MEGYNMLNPGLEHRLRAYENRMLWRLTGTEETAQRWRNLHNKGLHNVYSSPTEIGIMGTACSTHGNEKERKFFS
jgi:hypothetical protein